MLIYMHIIIFKKIQMLSDIYFNRKIHKVALQVIIKQKRA